MELPFNYNVDVICSQYTSKDEIVCLGIKQQAPANILSKIKIWMKPLIENVMSLFHNPFQSLKHDQMKLLQHSFPVQETGLWSSF